jgi:hypothetical protein
MRIAAKRAGVRPEVVKIDFEPEKVATRRADQAKILAELARSSQPGVLPDKLQKNPFVFDTAAPAASLPGAEPSVDPDAERIRSLLATTEINAIMQGPVPVARVNGRLVKVGDTIEGLLLVAQINDRSVDFIANNKTYTINMGDGLKPNGPARMPQPVRPPPGGIGPPRGQ